MTMLKGLVVSLCALLWLSAGCANTKAATASAAHGAIDAACTVAHSGVTLALGPVNDLYTNATIVVETLTTPAK